MAASAPDRLRAVLAPVLAAAGLDLDDVRLRRAGRHTTVVVVIDRDGPVTLDDVAAVSGPVSLALDESRVMGEASYTLEVTSPGAERPLTSPAHWRRSVGRLIKIVGADGTEVAGRLSEVGDDEVRLRITGEKGRISTATVRLDAVRRANVHVELNPRGAGAAAGPGPEGE